MIEALIDAAFTPVGMALLCVGSVASLTVAIVVVATVEWIAGRKKQ